MRLILLAGHNDVWLNLVQMEHKLISSVEITIESNLSIHIQATFEFKAFNQTLSKYKGIKYLKTKGACAF